MISRVGIKNFKSVVDAELPLGRFNVFIGANGCGKTNIPIPLLEIQQEIVNILNKFTELEAELEARKRQYEYYRNKLLSFEI